MANLKRQTAKKKQYLKHYKKAGTKYAMTYSEWLKKGSESVYFKGKSKPSVEAQMREARVTPKRKTLKRKKR